MVLSTIVCMLALLEFIGLGFVVGKARGTYGVEAPATSGHPEFDRRYRVHYNTLEQLVIFVPALFAFAWFVSDLWGALVGLVFVVGRALYAKLYIADPKSRGPGMGLTFLANVTLIFGAIGGAVWSLL
ncbi:MAG TPA: MAPEG family protein [Pseudomonadales bacterium]|nr:MAPEG family protein [Pseudomonadales bacterium]